MSLLQINHGLNFIYSRFVKKNTPFANDKNAQMPRRTNFCSHYVTHLYQLISTSMLSSPHFPIFSFLSIGCELPKILTPRKASTEMFRKSEAPAAERNKNPILEVLKTIIKVPDGHGYFPSVKILEVSSGTGQHIAYFAKHLSPQILWQPTEYDKSSFTSICAYIQDYKLQNVAPPVYVDIREHHTTWNPVCGEAEKSVTNIMPITKYEEGSFDYIYNSNLLHISPFECAEGLFFNSGKLLKKNGCLLTYGPYGQNGVISPESNVRFDAGLRASDASWGVRDIQLQLIPLAKSNNLELKNIIDMPSNNKTLVWQKL